MKYQQDKYTFMESTKLYNEIFPSGDGNVCMEHSIQMEISSKIILNYIAYPNLSRETLIFLVYDYQQIQQGD